MRHEAKKVLFAVIAYYGKMSCQVSKRWIQNYSKVPFKHTGPIIRTVLIFLGTLQL